MKRLFLLGLLFLSILAFGCIKMETYHKQHADGSADITEVVDLSKFYETMERMGNKSAGAEENLQFNKICEEVMKKDKGIICEANEEKKTITLRMKVGPEDAFYKFETIEGNPKKYRLTIDKLPTTNDEQSNQITQGGVISKSKLKPDQLTQLKAMGFEWTYTVEMPGKIISAEGAKSIKGNKAVFDVYEMMASKTPIVVESEASAFPCPLPTAILGVFFIGTVAGFVMERKG